MKSVSSYSQDTISPHSILLQAGGPGGYYSVNYLYDIKVFQTSCISSRVGLSSIHLKDQNNKFDPQLAIPVGLKFNSSIMFNPSFGTGVVYYSDFRWKNEMLQRHHSLNYYFEAEIGFTFKKHFAIGIAYTPIIENFKRYRHWGALNLSYQL